MPIGTPILESFVALDSVGYFFMISGICECFFGSIFVLNLFYS